MGTHPIFESDFDCLTAKMDLLGTLKWACLEVNNRRKVLIDDVFNGDLGSAATIGNVQGTYLASSKLGITVFDLFAEILDEVDLRRFLKEHQIDSQDFDHAGLVLRSFLLLVDLNQQRKQTQSQIPLISEETQIELIEVKSEPLPEQQQLEDTPGDFFVNTELLPVYPKVKKWPCKLSDCADVFDTFDELNEHRELVPHFEGEPCKEKMKTAKELRKHRESMACKFWRCPNCQMSFQTPPDATATQKGGRKRKLDTHINICTNQRPYVCDICGADFINKCELREHGKRHTVKGAQRREISRLNNLIRSEQRRVNPRAFKCDQCDQAYTTNQRLKFHKIRAHRNITFPCPHCTLQLATPATLRNHIRTIHEGSRKAALEARKNRRRKREAKATEKQLQIENLQTSTE